VSFQVGRKNGDVVAVGRKQRSRRRRKQLRNNAGNNAAAAAAAGTAGPAPAGAARHGPGAAQAQPRGRGGRREAQVASGAGEEQVRARQVEGRALQGLSVQAQGEARRLQGGLQ